MYFPCILASFVAAHCKRELVTCYFFPEGVDTSGEHWLSGFWCGGSGGKFLAGHKECSVATHHLSSSDGKKHMSEGCQNGVKKVPKS